jgi:hypothetical protein
MLIGDLYDANIRGDFRITYEVARTTDPDKKVTTGSFELRWGTASQQFTIEPAACWSATPGPGPGLTSCIVRHDPTRRGNAICLEAPSSPSSITVALDIWGAGDAELRLDLSDMIPQQLVYHSLADPTDTRLEPVPLAFAAEGVKTVYVDIPSPMGKMIPFTLTRTNGPGVDFTQAITIKPDCDL